VGISTHTKRLIGWIKNITAVLAKIYNKISHKDPDVNLGTNNDIAGKNIVSKSGFKTARKKLIVFFRSPLSDISHVSVIIVICIALITGLSSIVPTGGQVSINPFLTKKIDSAANYVSSDEKRIFEADLVTTLASIHSDKLGQDAASVTESLYKKENNTSAEVTTIANVPLLAPAIATSSQVGPTSTYVVQDGDTLSQIASKFNISTDTVRYANQLDDENSIKPGSSLIILSTSGILYTADPGDTIASVAAKYNLKEDDIIAQNNLYGDELTVGMKIVLPDAEIPAAPTPTPDPQEESSVGNNSNNYDPGISYVKTSTGPNHFPYGWCTWWVAQKRYVPWSGNAIDWYYNAQSYGRPVGSTPVPGSILVTAESGYGHVAYVESVNGNGSFNVSEMNYQGWGIASNRTISRGDGTPIIGFIY